MRRRWRSAARVAVLAALASHAAILHAATPASVTFLSVVINGVDTNVLATMMMRDGEMFMRAEDLESAGLVPPAEPAVEYQGARYKRLMSIPSLVYAVDDGKMQLVITCSAACYKVQTLTNADGKRRKPDEARGAALDYDLSFDIVAGESRALGGVFDGTAALFDGSLKSSFMHRISDIEKPLTLRLETSWTFDDEEDNVTYRLGDSVSLGSAWSIPVRFAGLQIATDFSLQPGFVYFPTPSVNGEAALPSTLEVYANDIRRFQGNVTPGPFSIADIPVLTGSGELRTVVVDVLGREQVIVEPYFATPELLKEGLSRFALQAGVMRHDYGLASFAYETPFASADYRYGLTDWLTTEVQGEWLQESFNVGGSAVTALSWLGLAEFGGAVSRTRQGATGHLYRAGYNWQSRLLNVGVTGQLTSTDFRQIGMLDDEVPPRLKLQTWLSLPVFDFGSLSLAYTSNDYRDGPDLSLASASMMVQVGKLGTLALTASHLIEDRDTTVMLSFTTFFGPLSTGTVTMQRGDDGAIARSATLNVGTPLQGGLGGYLTGSQGEDRRIDGGLRWSGGYGSLEAQAATTGDAKGVRLGARGSVVAIDGETFFGPPTRGSFALVKVGDYPNVTVLQDHRPTTTTNDAGAALLTGLRPYDLNHISFEAEELPLDADLSASSVAVVPRRQAGAVVEFKIAAVRALTVTLVDEAGQPLPPGTQVEIDGQPALLIGHDGEAYLTGMERQRRVTALLPNGACGLDIAPPPPDVLRTGPLTCAVKH